MVSKLERMDYNVKNKNTAETKNGERVSLKITKNYYKT